MWRCCWTRAGGPRCMRPLRQGHQACTSVKIEVLAAPALLVQGPKRIVRAERGSICSSFNYRVLSTGPRQIIDNTL